MNDSKQENRNTTEIIFSIGSEGGGISISRHKNNDEAVFIYHHNEFDPIDDEQLINVVSEFPTFEEAFQLIQERYRWYSLFIDTVHEDYRGYIAVKLLEKLNEDGASVAELRYNQEQLERVLGVKLHYRYDEQINQARWDCLKSD
jgi:hypothetical protein